MEWSFNVIIGKISYPFKVFRSEIGGDPESEYFAILSAGAETKTLSGKNVNDVLQLVHWWAKEKEKELEGE